jgi:hypothetical protein
MKSPGLEFSEESGVPVRTERMTVAEAVASKSLADDDPQVGIVHWGKA